MYKKYEEYRDKLGVKNIDVARATGIDPVTLSDWKRGKSTPKTDKLIKIAKYLGCKVEDLFEE